MANHQQLPFPWKVSPSAEDKLLSYRVETFITGCFTFYKLILSFVDSVDNEDCLVDNYKVVSVSTNISASSTGVEVILLPDMYFRLYKTVPVTYKKKEISNPNDENKDSNNKELVYFADISKMISENVDILTTPDDFLNQCLEVVGENSVDIINSYLIYNEETQQNESIITNSLIQDFLDTVSMNPNMTLKSFLTTSSFSAAGFFDYFYQSIGLKMVQRYGKADLIYTSNQDIFHGTPLKIHHKGILSDNEMIDYMSVSSFSAYIIDENTGQLVATNPLNNGGVPYDSQKLNITPIRESEYLSDIKTAFHVGNVQYSAINSPFLSVLDLTNKKQKDDNSNQDVDTYGRNTSGKIAATTKNQSYNMHSSVVQYLQDEAALQSRMKAKSERISILGEGVVTGTISYNIDSDNVLVQQLINGKFKDFNSSITRSSTAVVLSADITYTPTISVDKQGQPTIMLMANSNCICLNIQSTPLKITIGDPDDDDDYYNINGDIYAGNSAYLPSITKEQKGYEPEVVKHKYSKDDKQEKVELKEKTASCTGFICWMVNMFKRAVRVVKKVVKKVTEVLFE